MKTTNCYAHAKRELEILSKSTTDPNNRPIIEEFIPEILELCEKFGLSGQSGGSAPYTATALSQAIKKLCLFEPICPITGIDDEWDFCNYDYEDDATMYQNKRLSAIFKDGINGKPYYIDAVVFKGEDGNCFTTGNGVKLIDGSTIGSRQYIKSFPFTPKTFYIDVIETEWADRTETIKKAGGGWWTSVVKNEKQLNTVWRYYNRYEK